MPERRRFAPRSGLPLLLSQWNLATRSLWLLGVNQLSAEYNHPHQAAIRPDRLTLLLFATELLSVPIFLPQRLIAITIILAGGCTFSVPLHAEQSRPNILWITAEDMSPTLGCYGDPYAITPNIDRLAGESVQYTHAFATTPVCSPARSCLITGCYATSLGTQQMRSAFPIPETMRGFPALLREQGYYTTNNVKTDYNTANWKKIIEASWDESSGTAHWRKRPKNDQPFFSIFNLMTSHQSRTMVWTRDRFVKEVQSRLDADEIHDPAKAPLPPYYPDTPVIRRTVARFYDCVTAMDKEVGAILRQLEDDGLADDTIVFFYSDHGSGMPRHKRALLDSGMHVPLMVRFPAKYRHLAPTTAGKTLDRLVSFVDFGPTVLSLAAVEIPQHMQGRAFLGEAETTPRELVYGHRDRVDEAIDLARSVRDKQYLYIRNYMPHLSYNQPTAWPDLGEIRHEFYRLAQESAMTPAQWHFAGPSKPVEELYDCESDPRNLNNLAASQQHRDVLARMRKAHRRHLRETRDLGFIPEPESWRILDSSTPWQTARERELGLDALYHAASAVGTADESKFSSLLENKNAAIRYWGAVGLAQSKQMSDATIDKLRQALQDRSAAVRIASANVLARHGDANLAMPKLIELLSDKDLNVVLHAARTVELLGDVAHEAIPAMREVAERSEKLRPSDTPATFVLSGEQDLAMFCSFAANAFLSRFAAEPWTDLFDGKTLAGWNARAEGEVSVVDGEIQILAKGKNLWLVHEDSFDDFELTVEVRMPAKGGYNSGIGFRCTGQGRPKGYQCEVEEQKSGMIYAIGSGWVWPKGPQQTKQFQAMTKDAFRGGEWNKFRIRCEGDHIQIWLNDVKTADVHDGRFTAGSVALQHHGKGAVHRFRDVRIRKLSR